MRLLPQACALATLAACSSAPTRPGKAPAATDVDSNAPWSLQLAADRVLGGAAPIAATVLPAAVRHQVAKLVPDGRLLQQFRRWGPAGDSYELQVRDGRRDSPLLHLLTLTADGELLSFQREVPLPQTPAAVLGAALQFGTRVDSVHFVAAAAQADCWRCVVRDLADRSQVVETDVNGNVLRRWQRVQATIDWLAAD